jgi:hypothetical protein
LLVSVQIKRNPRTNCGVKLATVPHTMITLVVKIKIKAKARTIKLTKL